MSESVDQSVLDEARDMPPRLNAPPKGERTARKAAQKALLWLVIGLLFAFGVIAFGVHVGAQGQDAWYTDAVRWLAG